MTDWDDFIVTVLPPKHKPAKAHAPVLKFNPNHEPAGSPEGGQFASGDGGGTGVGPDGNGLAGVDMAANAQRILGEIKLSANEKAAAAALAKDLQDAPLIHATTVGAAETILAGKTGIESRVEVLDEVEGLKAHWADEIRGLIETAAEDQAEFGAAAERLRDERLAKLDTLMRASELDELEAWRLTRNVLHSVRAGEELEAGLEEQLKPILGKTYDADRALGLDRYVFGSLGEPAEKWWSYGNVLLVIDPEQARRAGAFATPEDIASYAVGTAPGGRYSADVVRVYRDQMVTGADLPRVAAAMQVGRDADGDPISPLGRWEVKIPTRIPRSALKGVIVTDADDYARLEGIVPAKLLHYLPSDATRFPERVRARATSLVRTGTWPDTEDGEGYRSPVDPTGPAPPKRESHI